jgi:hypothetical protein
MLILRLAGEEILLVSELMVLHMSSNPSLGFFEKRRGVVVSDFTSGVF